MKIWKISSNFRMDIDKRYPLATNYVDGLEVLSDIPNTSSISASLTDYYILKGVRIVPMSDFDITGKGYSVSEDTRIKQLAKSIEHSKKISPLIVVVEPQEPYILEGSHRIDALYLIGAKYFPALVVVDMEIAANLEQKELDKWHRIWDKQEGKMSTTHE